MDELIPLEIPVTLQTIRLIKSYAALSGKETSEISRTLGENVSTILEARLKDLIATEVGATILGEGMSVAITNTAYGHTQGIPHNEMMVDGLGDDQDVEDPQDIPPSPQQVIPRKGGITIADIDHDMDIDDPSVEAKAEPLDMVNPKDTGSDDFAEAMGYIDSRIMKRKKRFGQGRAKVTALSERVMNEGNG